MEYVKGSPFFCQGEKIKRYPYLNKDASCEVLIIGGGIVGAIANFYISQKYVQSLLTNRVLVETALRVQQYY